MAERHFPPVDAYGWCGKRVDNGQFSQPVAYVGGMCEGWCARKACNKVSVAVADFGGLQ